MALTKVERRIRIKEQLRDLVCPYIVQTRKFLLS